MQDDQPVVHEQWDTDVIRARIVESQRRRRFLAPLMRAQQVVWDYQPGDDAAQSYIRNTKSIYELEKQSRFPNKQ